MKTTLLSCCLSAALILASCGGRAVRTSSSSSAPEACADSTDTTTKTISTMEQLKTLPDEPVFDIVTSEGTIRIKLYSNTPEHRKNFAKLALEGFYDGILFHRVINGFMIQTGDPLSKDPSKVSLWGTGGPGYNVPAEISAGNRHQLGALAAARRGNDANPLRESSGSQFYIVQSESGCSHLDGQYTVFGQTIEGFEVIERIASVPTDGRDRPLTPVVIEKVVLVK